MALHLYFPSSFGESSISFKPENYEAQLLLLMDRYSLNLRCDFVDSRKVSPSTLVPLPGTVDTVDYKYDWT